MLFHSQNISDNRWIFSVQKESHLVLRWWYGLSCMLHVYRLTIVHAQLDGDSMCPDTILQWTSTTSWQFLACHPHLRNVFVLNSIRLRFSAKLNLKCDCLFCWTSLIKNCPQPLQYHQKHYWPIIAQLYYSLVFFFSQTMVLIKSIQNYLLKPFFVLGIHLDLV